MLFFLRLFHVLSISSVLLMTLSIALPLYAQDLKDKAGGRDYHPFGRYQNSILHNYGVNLYEETKVPLDEYEYKDGLTIPKKFKAIAGRFYHYVYWGPKDESAQDIFNGYKEVLQKSDFKILFSCSESAQCQKMKVIEYAADWSKRAQTFEGGFDEHSQFEYNAYVHPLFLVAAKEGFEGDTYAILTVIPQSNAQELYKGRTRYYLQVVEENLAKKREVTVFSAEEMQQQIAYEGKISLFAINFTNGSTTVEDSSLAQLKEMAFFLTSNPDIRVFVVGHTDRNGDYKSNLELSQKRADAVKKALIEKYNISEHRMMAIGVANVAPISSSTSEKGRSKNRRVVLVIQ